MATPNDIYSFLDEPAADPVGSFLDEPAPERSRYTMGDLGRDTGSSLLNSAVNLGESTAGVTDLAVRLNPINQLIASGRALTSDADAPLAQRYFNELGRMPTPSDLLRDAGAAPDFQRARETINRLKSDELQGKLREAEQAQGFVGSMSVYLQNPGLLASSLVEQAGSFLGVGGLTRQASQTAARGIAGQLDELAPAAAQRLLRETTERAGTRTAIGAAAGMEAGAAYNATREQILALPEDQLSQLPEYRRLVEEGNDPAEAKRILANTAATLSAPTAALLSTLANRVSGAAKLEADIFGGASRASGVGNAAARLAGATAREGAQGAAEEGGAQFSQNLGYRAGTGDDRRSLLEGVPEAAGAGAVLEGAMGGGARALTDVGRALEGREQAREQEDAARPEGRDIAALTRAPLVTDAQGRVVPADVSRRTVPDEGRPANAGITDTGASAGRERLASEIAAERYRPTVLQSGQAVVEGDRQQIKRDFEGLGGVWNARLNAMVFPARFAGAVSVRAQQLNTAEPQPQPALVYTPEQREPLAVDAQGRAATETERRELGMRPERVPRSGFSERAAQLPPVEGRQIDREWSEFAPESQTLAVPRAEMPQVKAEHRGALVNFLNARGIAHETREIDPRTLKPTQAEFSPAKVQKAREFEGGDRSILVSSDGHVVDGHHQWLAKRDSGETMKVIVLDAPIRDLLPQVSEFPSATKDEGAAASRSMRTAGGAEAMYSQLTRTVEQARQPKGPAPQWKAWIKNQPGIKREEIEWSGVEQWLDEQKGPVTREQLADFLRQNEAQVEETVLGGETVANVQREYEQWRYENRLPRREMDELEAEALSDEQLGQLNEFQDRRHSAAQSPAKFSQYQTPGGENYRELLLTLPGGETKAQTVARRDAAWERIERSPGFPAGDHPIRHPRWAQENVPELYAEWSAANDAAERRPVAGDATFRSSHFDQPNILAHVRFNERSVPVSAAASIEDIEQRIMQAVPTAKSADSLGSGAPDLALRKGLITEAEAGKYSAHREFRNADFKTHDRVLFVEEVQSDWHQKGRKAGYSQRDRLLREREAQESIRNRSATNSPEYAEAKRRIREIDERIEANADAVPDAPFKQSWPLLAMKRMIRYAAENGFDRIAWTTGEQQAGRYDLSKQIETIEYRRRPNGGGHIVADDKAGKLVLSERVDSDAKLADYIGKEAADRIMQQQPMDNLNTEDKSYVLHGADLKVGGEGMRAFYDRELVNEVGKYVKKWGSKVDKLYFDPYNPQTRSVQNDSVENAVALGAAPVHAIEVTPAMREAAMAGQPMFSRRGTMGGRSTPAGGRDEQQADTRRSGRPEAAAADDGSRGRAAGPSVQAEGQRPGQVRVRGVHYSSAPRAALDGRFWGAGLADAARRRLAKARDRRLTQRIYLYVDEGSGVQPEQGVGAHAHDVEIGNLYDAASDPLNLAPRAAGENSRNTFERRVLDAGFDGYYVAGAFGNQGAAVILGEASQNVAAAPRQAQSRRTGESNARQAPDVRNPAARSGRLADLQRAEAADARRAGRPPADLAEADVPAALRPLAAAVRQAFSKEVVFFRGNTDFDGVAVGTEYIYVREDSQHPQLTVLFHELFHSMRRSDPQLYDLLTEFAEPLLTNREAYARERGVQGESAGYVTEEMLADLFAEQALRPDFWEDVASYTDRSTMRRLADWIMELVQRLLGTADGVGMDRFARDYEQLQQLVREYAGAYATRTPDGQQSEASFSRRTEAPSAGAASRFLTADERAKLRRDTAVRLQEIWRDLPSAKEMSAVALAGGAKRGWYENSTNALRQVFGEDAPRFASLLAAMSPQTSVESNLKNALNTWANWTAARRPTDRNEIVRIMGRSVEGSRGEDSVLGAWINNSVRALTVGNPQTAMLSGPKVQSFFRNLTGRYDEVTNDAWMATFADIDQKLFKGRMNKAGDEPGKGPGYLALTARVRQAAQVLSQITGEQWTPAEVQETIWSWAKTTYELSTSAAETRSARELVREDAVTDEMIGATPDFGTLLNERPYSTILERAGLAGRLQSADGSASAGQPAARVFAGTRRQAAQAAADPGRRYLDRAAARLDAVRQRRGEDRGLTDAELGLDDADFAFSRRDGSGRDRSGALAPLAGAPTVPGGGPNEALVRVAEQYAREAGIELRRQAEYVEVDEGRAQRLAQAYEDMVHAPNDPAVREAYQNLIRQTVAQYRALERAGYRFWLFDDDSDPYGGNPWNAMRDLRATKSMGVYATAAGFGSGATDVDVSDNPLYADTGIRWPSGSPDGSTVPVLANDLFRAVHDAFGHGLEGAGFRARGEENAWQAHARLFTGSALAALTSETRGQNSWLNFGRFGEQNRNAGLEGTVFADQKTGLMPEWTWTEGRVGDAPAFSRRAKPQAETPESQVAAVRAKFAGTAQWMRAPNGKPTNLKERQWLEVRTPNFKRWFGDWEAYANREGGVWNDDDGLVSKVVDENGEPLIVYHGSEKAGFDTFDPSISPRGVHGTFFTSDRSIARTYSGTSNEAAISMYEGRERVDAEEDGEDAYRPTRGVYPVFLNIRRPGEEYFEGANWDGSRNGQWEVLDADGEPVFAADGRRYLSEEEAEALAAAITGAEVHSPDEMWTTTNGVVEAARRAGLDGAIIREVVDNGPLGDAWESSDVFVAFDPHQVKSATLNRGTFDPEDPRINFSRRIGTQRRDVDFDNSPLGEETRKQRLERRWVDRFNRVRDAQEYLAGRGHDIAEDANVYEAEQLYYGKTKARFDQLEDRYVRPIIDQIRMSDLTLEEVDEYLYARHAEERNKVIADRNPDFPDGGSGMSTAEAQRILSAWKNTPKGRVLERIANKVDAMHSEKLAVLETNGLVHRDEIDAWRQAYAHYVPLKTYQEPGEGGNNLGMGYDVRGRESQLAFGRGTRADSPLVNAFLDYERTLIRQGKAEVGQALLKLVRDYPEPGLWEIKTPADFTALAAFKDDQGNIDIREVMDSGFRFDDDIFIVKDGGKEKILQIHDEVLARQLHKLGGGRFFEDEELNTWFRNLGKATNIMGRLLTQYSPVFTITNFARDIQTAAVNAMAYGLRPAQVVKGVPKAMGAITSSLRNRAHPWSAYYRDFVSDGVMTGHFGLEDLQVMRDGIRSQIQTLSQAPNAEKAKRALLWVGEKMSNVNMVVEDATRLSAYVAAREKGLSRQKAAILAKNLTINFNRKGELGQKLNSWFMFFNAAIQGTKVLYDAAKTRPVKYAIAGFMLAGAAMEVLNRLMAGDDEELDENNYAKLSDWEKDHNWIVAIPGAEGGRLKFPMPYGLNAFYAVGRRFAGIVFFGDPVFKSLVSMTGAFVDAFNPVTTADFGMVVDPTKPIGEAALQMAAPSIAQPVVDLAFNRDFMDRPIVPEPSPFDKAPPPDSERFFNGATQFSKALAQGLNTLTGGDRIDPGLIDVSPETIDYLAKNYSGGMGALFMQMLDVGVKAAEGKTDEIEIGRLPVINRLSSGPSPYYVGRRYREIETDLARMLERAKDPELRGGLTPKQVTVASMYRGADASLRKLYAVRRRLRDSGKDVKDVDAEIERRQAAVIKAYNSLGR